MRKPRRTRGDVGRLSMATGGRPAPLGQKASFAESLIAAREPIRANRYEIPKVRKNFSFAAKIILGEAYDQPDKH